ncbi:CCC motif membrane protein [Tenacibaculum sp. XPcli2-G]|uniref:CCC motif membrane protein n=1 Tax=Tenacibaculum sp. XPcli2-G TaxID=2954503 RepID=UPI00209768E1|nr:CCC motif membrane protein [Tenacibaculum sp. XPcli2-G]MCO7185393.1 CCC motif membrane protein [Tenacibaculum sp. XPcli2-G]
MEKQKLPNSTGVLVLGIISILGCCCYGFIGLILGVVALVLAKKATTLYNENPDEYDGINNVKIGKILAIIGVILSSLYIITMVGMILFFGWDALQDPELLREQFENMQ